MQTSISKDMRKFKEWKDAEYVVKSLETSVMRLSIDGVFAERKACSRVWIEHKGTPVSVGSGFTADERVRYANDPSLIVSDAEPSSSGVGKKRLMVVALRSGRRSRSSTSRNRGR